MKLCEALAQYPGNDQWLADMLVRKERKRRKMTDPATVAFRYYHLMSAEAETFAVIALDAANQVVDEREWTGTTREVAVPPVDIFRFVIRSGATRMLMVHNHPSGDPDPSSADVAMTRRMIEAAKILGLEVMDHIVLGAGEWRSIRGLL